MLWTISAILLGLWTLGLISGSTVGYWVHLFLLFAILSLILAVVRTGRPRWPGRPLGPPWTG